MERYNCGVPIKRLGGGYFLFGTKKIFAKILNGQLVVRVGGGYMVIDEFIDNYSEAEEHKIQMKIERGEDPFSSTHSDSTGKKRSTSRSPRSKRKRGNTAL